MRTQFKSKDGESHDLYFKGKQKPELILASKNPKGIEDKIQEAIADLSDKDPEKQAKLSALKKALSLSTELKNLISNDVAKSVGKEKNITGYKNKIENYLKEIKSLLVANWSSGAAEADLPLTNVTFQTMNGKAYKVEANPLTKLPGNTKGSVPKEDPPGWSALTEEQRLGSFVRAHLLNHHLHGPGESWNLTPALRWVNTTMETQAEKMAKKLVGKNKVMYYETIVFYHDKGNTNFPRQIKISMGELIKEGNHFKKDKDQGRVFDHPLYEQSHLKITSFNDSTASQLIKTAKDAGVGGLSTVLSDIVKARNLQPGRRFGNVVDLNKAMNAYYKIEKNVDAYFDNNYRAKINELFSKKDANGNSYIVFNVNDATPIPI